MASLPQYIDGNYTDEERYFLIFANLVTTHSPEAVRVVFNQEFPPVTLKEQLRRIDAPLKVLLVKGYMNRRQWCLLFPPDIAGPSSKSFDITLMILLLRHIAHYQIHDEICYVREKMRIMTNEDSLSVIKHYRNFLAHSESGRLTSSEFDTCFTDVSEAITFIRPEMKDVLRKLKSSDISPLKVKAEIENLIKIDQLETEQESLRFRQDIMEEEFKRVKELVERIDIGEDRRTDADQTRTIDTVTNRNQQQNDTEVSSNNEENMLSQEQQPDTNIDANIQVRSIHQTVESRNNESLTLFAGPIYGGTFHIHMNSMSRESQQPDSMIGNDDANSNNIN